MTVVVKVADCRSTLRCQLSP